MPVFMPCQARPMPDCAPDPGIKSVKSVNLGIKRIKNESLGTFCRQSQPKGFTTLPDLVVCGPHLGGVPERQGIRL